LFTVAAGFSAMKLTDPKQALGLPEGSIRAMIALVLIMIFIIFGIYLFRNVSGGIYNLLETKAAPPDLANYVGKKVIVEKNPQNQYEVWVLWDVSDDGKRFAQVVLTR